MVDRVIVTIVNGSHAWLPLFRGRPGYTPTMGWHSRKYTGITRPSSFPQIYSALYKYAALLIIQQFDLHNMIFFKISLN